VVVTALGAMATVDVAEVVAAEVIKQHVYFSTQNNSKFNQCKCGNAFCKKKRIK
jgi:acetone carboxylase gamma subunit